MPPPRLSSAASALAVVVSPRRPQLCRIPLPLLPAVSPQSSSHRFYAAQRERVKPTGDLFDEQIDASVVKYVDDKGVYQGEQPLRALLRRIPRHTHAIRCVGHETIKNDNDEVVNVIPICKLVSKEELAEARQRAYREKKEKKKENKGKSSKNQKHVVKSLEFTWAISRNDLNHRLRKMQQFLEKGNRVEVTIGVKKGMQKMTMEDVRELAREVDEFALRYGKEMREPEGELGRRMMLFYEGHGVKGSDSGEAVDGESSPVEGSTGSTTPRESMAQAGDAQGESGAEGVTQGQPEKGEGL